MLCIDVETGVVKGEHDGGDKLGATSAFLEGVRCAAGNQAGPVY